MKPMIAYPSGRKSGLLMAALSLVPVTGSWATQLPDAPPPDPLLSVDQLQITPEAAPIPPQQIPRLTWVARQLIKQGRFADVSSLCQRLLRIQPGNVTVRAQLAAAYKGLGEEARFKKERDIIVQQKPRSAALYLALASTYVALKELDQARAAYQQGLEVADDKIDLLLGLGSLYQQQQNLARAREQYLEVLKQKRLRDKAYLNASFALSRIDLQEKRYPETIHRAQEIVKLYPPLPQGYLLLGAAYRGNGQPELAAKTYQELIQANPRVPEGYHQLALTYLDDLNRPKAALRYAQEGVNRFPQDPRSLDISGWVAYQTGHYPEAAEQFQKASRLSRGDPRMLYHLGLALQKSGHLPQARKAFQTALEQIDQKKAGTLARELQKRIAQIR